MKGLNYYLHITAGCSDCPFERYCMATDCIVLKEKEETERFMDIMNLSFEEFMVLMEYMEVADDLEVESIELEEYAMEMDADYWIELYKDLQYQKEYC